MVIQRVIAMSNEASAQSGKTDVSPAEAEYNAVYAAVTATERGRWFLAEFANRNRKADTDLILAAIARVEAAIRAGAAPAVPQGIPQPVERRGEATSVTSSEPVSGEPAASTAERRFGGERDEDVVTAPDVATAQDKFAAEFNAEESSQPAPMSASKVLTDEDYSDAVAAIAASLATRLKEPVSGPPEVENLVEDAAANEPQPVSASVPEARGPQQLLQRRVPQDNSPRWHIEGPDFVFGAAGSDGAPETERLQEAAQLQAQLLGAEIMSAHDVPEQIAALPDATARPLPPRTAADTFFEAPPAPQAAQESAQNRDQESAAQSFASALEVTPLAEIARPQMRPAREATPSQRPPRYGSLTVTDALSEDEVIALFG